MNTQDNEKEENDLSFSLSEEEKKKMFIKYWNNDKIIPYSYIDQLLKERSTRFYKKGKEEERNNKKTNAEEDYFKRYGEYPIRITK